MGTLQEQTALHKKRKSSPDADKHYKFLKGFFKRKLKKAYWHYIENVFSGNPMAKCEVKDNKQNTSKQVWSFIKSRRYDNTVFPSKRKWPASF